LSHWLTAPEGDPERDGTVLQRSAFSLPFSGASPPFLAPVEPGRLRAHPAGV